MIFYAITIIGCMGLILGQIPFGVYFAFVVLFSVFDVLGFYFVLTHKTQVINNKERLIAYRAMQITFQILLIMISPIDGIAFLMAWWFGVCDLLYYILLSTKVRELKQMTWLKWTIWGIFYNLFHKEITGKDLIFWSIVGFIAGAACLNILMNLV